MLDTAVSPPRTFPYNLSVTDTILQTKLYIPPIRPSLVPRPHLIAKLKAGLAGKLTLVSAPAGFGKTTLVSEWIADCKRPFAWLSLDERDSDLTRFLTYLIAAIQTLAPTAGERTAALLASPNLPPTDAVLTALLNEMSAVPQEMALVLDDYHVVDARPIDAALTFLLDHLPPQLHLVITTREDPNLPLSRLRVRGQLTEIRAADLRFTLAETAVFLHQVTGLELSPEEIAALERRTEGWVAGLQLAALSMQGRGDVPDFIETFAGDNRYVVDYLVEEVLQRQPPRMRQFLLQTSILERLCGPLCTAVTHQEASSDRLEELEHNNLFVIPLDDRRQWYRYHHLFADVLQARLMKEQPEELPGLHQRASAWYEQNGFTADAVHHALAAQDFEGAAALVELAWPAIFKGFQPAAWLTWVKALPADLISVRPVLSVGYAWTLLDNGVFEKVDTLLSDAERLLDIPTESIRQPDEAAVKTDSEPKPKLVVVNEEAFRSLSATIATGRAYLAQSLGDVSIAVEKAQYALDLLPEEDHYWRGIAALFLGLAYWTRGELENAGEAIADCVAQLHRADNTYFQIVGTVVMANIRMAQGRLREAESTFRHALQLAAGKGDPLLQGTVDLYVGLSELHRERGDLETAVNHLQKGKKLGTQSIFPGSAYRLRMAEARIKVAQGNLDSALDLLHEAERLYKRDAVLDLRPAAALKAQVWLLQGNLTAAEDWARSRGLSADAEISYLHAFEFMTLARLLIAQTKRDQIDDSIHEAMGLLERLLKAAEAEGRMGSVIEILVLQALAYQELGEMANALATSKRALALAEPEGYGRVFTDEGQPMRTLLAAALAQGADPVYVTHLMRTIDQQLDGETAVSSPNQLLLEPLSNRELEVLGLLANGLSNQAIADELVIALSTVKKHVNNVFGKLNVANRTQAVNRARDLNIL